MEATMTEELAKVECNNLLVKGLRDQGLMAAMKEELAKAECNNPSTRACGTRPWRLR